MSKEPSNTDDCEDLSAAPESDKKATKKGKKQPRLTGTQMAQIESLYCIKGKQLREIVDITGIAYDTVKMLVYRRQLTKKRDERNTRIAERLNQKAAQESDAALERWALQSEDVTESTFDLAREILASDSKTKAKDIAAAASALRNLTSVYRESKGIGKTQSTQIGTQNVFIGQLQRVSEKNVSAAQESIDIP